MYVNALIAVIHSLGALGNSHQVTFEARAWVKVRSETATGTCGQRRRDMDQTEQHACERIPLLGAAVGCAFGLCS